MHPLGDLGLGPCYLLEGATEVPGAGTRQSFVRPRDRSFNEPIDLADSGAVGEADQRSALLRREPATGEAVQCRWGDVGQDENSRPEESPA